MTCEEELLSIFDFVVVWLRCSAARPLSDGFFFGFGADFGGPRTVRAHSSYDIASNRFRTVNRLIKAQVTTNRFAFFFKP